MKALLKINGIKIVQIMFGLLFGLMLFPSVIKSIIIGAISVFIITYSICYKNKFNTKLFLLNASLYFAILLTLFYSNDWSYASLTLQTMSSLLVFPLIFSFLSNTDVVNIFRNLKIYFWIYIIAVNVFNVFPFLWYLITQDTLEEITRHYPRVIIIDFGRFSIHPIYMSMHTSIAILFSIHLFRNTKIKLNKIILIFLTCTLVLFLLIYLKKGPVIALIITLLVWSFFELRKYLKSNILFIGMLVTLLIVIPQTRNKFLELINIEIATQENPNSTNIRYTLFNNSVDLIEESPIIGYGIGDYNAKLKETFKKNATFLLDKTYNSHNQYLSFMLIGGIGLLLLFLFFYYKNLSMSIKHNNIFLILFLVFYGVMMFFENILERENGVIFVAFFINLFALKNYTRLEN